jgi:Fic/DOC family
MAAVAAKYAHCQVRAPVPYHVHGAFRPDVAAPLDFAPRAAELFALDRELDRAVFGLEEYQQLVVEAVGDLSGPGGWLRSERLAPDRTVDSMAGAVPASLGPRRRQFAVNLLRFSQDTAQFRPPWTVPIVREAHRVLLDDIGRPPLAGEWRTEPFIGRGARGEPLYETCPPEQVSTELAALLEWVDRYGPALHPVVPAAVLLQGFRTIRPFPLGNATVGAAIALAHLRESGLPNASLVPMGRTSSESSALLERLSLWTQASGSYSDLIDLHLDRLVTAYLAAIDRWLGPHRTPPGLDEVALRVLSRTRRSPGWFTPEEAARWVGGRGRTTVRRHLNDLVARGFLESIGRTRGKRYRAPSPQSLVSALMARFSLASDRPSDSSAGPGRSRSRPTRA